MAKAESTSKRRMGPLDSEMSNAMLDSAEKILREEGYGALTSRRVAEETGAKQRLVYYYFHTMDDLIVETYRRTRVRETERLVNALASDQPVRKMWEVCIHTEDSRLVSEFIALANRIESLRTEIVGFIEDSRKMQVEALNKALARTQSEPNVPLFALAMLATSAALALHREARIGVKSGHEELRALIEKVIGEAEPVAEKPKATTLSARSNRAENNAGSAKAGIKPVAAKRKLS